MRGAGSLTPSFETRVFAGDRSRQPRLGAGDARPRPLPEGTAVSSTSAAWSTGTAPTSGVPSCPGSRQEFVGLPRRWSSPPRRAGGAARPGALARDVTAACRAPIEEAGFGEHFRHRMGHGIGLDIHERPFLSVRGRDAARGGHGLHRRAVDHLGSFGMRIENVVVCGEGGARVLSDYPNDLVTNP